eukprot:6770945-Pyramimonas_sp.AAC.1
MQLAQINPSRLARSRRPRCAAAQVHNAAAAADNPEATLASPAATPRSAQQFSQQASSLGQSKQVASALPA